jgi:hypothetical protein
MNILWNWLKSNQGNSNAAHICACLSFVSRETAFVQDAMNADVFELFSAGFSLSRKDLLREGQPGDAYGL